MFSLLSLLGCAEPPAPVLAPETHSWQQEAELVVSGLAEVLQLWDQSQQPAARTLAERVYTERFEPRLEPALEQMEGPKETAVVEYSFGQLEVALEGKDRGVIDERISLIDRRMRAIAESAERAFPPPGQAASAPPPPKDVKPIVPDVPPNWETDNVAEPIAPAQPDP